jgi:hypothetical protein
MVQDRIHTHDAFILTSPFAGSRSLRAAFEKRLQVLGYLWSAVAGNFQTTAAPIPLANSCRAYSGGNMPV